MDELKKILYDFFTHIFYKTDLNHNIRSNFSGKKEFRNKEESARLVTSIDSPVRIDSSIKV